MLLTSLIREVLYKYDDECVERFIEEKKFNMFDCEVDDDEYEKKRIEKTFEYWYGEPIEPYYVSIFKWNGQYWKDGEKKLEYVCELYYDKIRNNMFENLSKQKHKLPFPYEYEELFVFDLRTGRKLKKFECFQIDEYIPKIKYSK